MRSCRLGSGGFFPADAAVEPSALVAVFDGVFALVTPLEPVAPFEAVVLFVSVTPFAVVAAFVGVAAFEAVAPFEAVFELVARLVVVFEDVADFVPVDRLLVRVDLLLLSAMGGQLIRYRRRESRFGTEPSASPLR